MFYDSWTNRLCNRLHCLSSTTRRGSQSAEKLASDIVDWVVVSSVITRVRKVPLVEAERPDVGPLCTQLCLTSRSATILYVVSAAWL